MKRLSLFLVLAACGTSKSIAQPQTTTKTTPTSTTTDVTTPATTTTPVQGTTTPPAGAAKAVSGIFAPHGLDAKNTLTENSLSACGHGAANGIRCNASVRLNASNLAFTGATPAGMTAQDLAQAYNLAGQGPVQATVALVDLADSPDAESDLGTYRAQFGLPACTHANGCFKKVNQDGQDLADQASSQPVADPNWGGEITLDIEMASVGCPSCKILLVEAYGNSEDDLFIAQDTARKLGATVISNSWGYGGEWPEEVAYDAYFNHPGVATFFSSGDSAYGAQYPATSPYVIAVGGTNLGQSSDGISEVAWDGAGSGCSAYESKPQWQTDSLCPNRAESDISAVADPYTGVAVYYTFPFANGDGTFDVQGGWMVYGGTSVASPLVAAIFAQTGHGADDASTIYNNPSAFYDVTAGSNGECGKYYLCNAGSGYDGPTGVGSPDGAELAKIPPMANGTSGSANKAP